MSGSSQRQQEYLRAMGIQSWVRRGTVFTADDSDVAEMEVAEPGIESETADVVSDSSLTSVASPNPAEETRPVVTTTSHASITEVPVVDTNASQPRVSQPGASQTDNPEHEYIAASGWKDLQSRVSKCTVCDLHNSRTQPVFGVGDQQADWLIVGEAPGAEEDQQGEPFVGSAGQLLNKMLLAIGLQRKQVYITNIVKCRPPGNRDPRPNEVAQCQPFLDRQVALLQPKVILAVGRIAAHNLLKTDEPLGRLRGKQYQFESGDALQKIPLVVTYHPAYLLRSPKEKRKAWQDLQYAVAVSQGTVKGAI